MAIHELKTWPMFFKAIRRQEKTFEVRKNDRNFQKGDRLHLLEFEPISARYTGDEIICDVTYVLHGRDTVNGIHEGFCVMGIQII